MIAHDYDFLSAIPEVNTFYASRYWSETDFQNILQGFAKRQNDHRRFHQTFPYGWTTNRDAYEFSIDAMYQLQAVDTIAGIWHDSSALDQQKRSFDHICIRQTRRWGGPADISPRAVPASARCPVQFVLVPFGWDNYISMAIEGFAAHQPQLFASSLADLANRPGQTPRVFNEDAAPFLKALAVCSLISSLDCPEILVPAAHDLLIQEVPALKGARLHLACHSHLSRPLGYAQAVGVYSIAHEIGHHLQGLYGEVGEGKHEYVADTLACRGLWNYPAGIGSVCPKGERYDALTLLAGGLFAHLIELGLASDRITQDLVKQKTHPNNPYIANRKDLWASFTERLVSRSDELEQPWAGIQSVIAGFERYQAFYLDSLPGLITEALPLAEKLVQTLVAKNPNMDDPDAIAERFRKEIDASI